MDFLTVLQNFGVSVACLAALGFAVWRALVWVGVHVAKPVADRHIRFLDELSTATASQSLALQTMSVQQGKNLDGIERIMIRMEEVIEKQDALVRTVQEVHSKVQNINVHSDSVIIHEAAKKKDG